MKDSKGQPSAAMTEWLRIEEHCVCEQVSAIIRVEVYIPRYGLLGKGAVVSGRDSVVVCLFLRGVKNAQISRASVFQRHGY